MNTHIKISGWLLFLTGSMLFILAACKKENNTAAPVINSVRALDSTKRDSTFSSAFPGAEIVINGANFNGLQAVFFNNLNANVNVALATSTRITIGIPMTTPTKATDPNVPNELRVVTSHGTATYTFQVVQPPPTVSWVSNENAIAGETITITGTNYILISKVVFPGNVAGTNMVVNSPTQITVTVPPGLTQSGPLQVVGGFGTGQTVFPVNSAASGFPGFLANFEDGNPYFGWAYWGGIKTNDGSNFPDNTGNYIEIHNASSISAGDMAWYQDNRAVNVDSVKWLPVANLNDPIANYAFKFEMSLKTTWSAGSLYIVKDGDWTYLAPYRGWQTATGAVAPMQPGGWQTVTIPLTSFKTTPAGGANGSGASAISLTKLLNPTGSGRMNVMFVNDGSTAIASFDAAFDNLRIVRIQ